MKPKKYLHFITEEGNRDHVENMTKHWEWFDGIFAVIHKGRKEDGTQKLIESRKKGGCVQTLDCYYKRHNLAMNMNLHHPTIQHGDWIFLIDTMERINDSLFENNAEPINSLLEELEKMNLQTLAFEGKTFFFRRFLYDQEFLGSPHWYLFNGHGQQQVELKSLHEESLSDARINLRPQCRPHDHSIDHFVKYLWDFADSNQGIMECENDKERFNAFEMQRRMARQLAIENGIPTTTLEFSNWLIDNKGNYPDFLIDLFQQQDAKAFRNFYRSHVLEEDYDTIKKTENTWEFKK